MHGAGVFEGVECADSGGGADHVFVGGWIAGTPSRPVVFPRGGVFLEQTGGEGADADGRRLYIWRRKLTGLRV